MASSDDEGDKHHHEQHVTNPVPPKPMRRASWLNEVQTIPHRKSSFTGVVAHSPTNSQPTTPSADPSPWATAGGSRSGQAHASGNPHSWGSAIWSNEPRKEPPARLTEVLPSPTSIVPPAPYGDGDTLLSPTSREQTGDSTIPFAIPLHPTPKTYRSQSYSVGQLDPESNPNITSYVTGRARPHPSNRIQHRPSHPGLLADVSEGSALSRVREADDDDDDSLDGSQQGVKLSPEQPTLESLARENALLRQAAASNQLENQRLRNRAVSANNVPGNFQMAHVAPAPNPQRAHGAFPEESDYAIDELDELSELQSIGGRSFSPRRFSEYSAEPEGQFSSFTFPENRKIESLKKGHWQSSLGFGGHTEGAQSRRHSFATVPARNGSVTSIGDGALGRDGDAELARRNSTSTEISGNFSIAENNALPRQGESGEYAHFRIYHGVEEAKLHQQHSQARSYALSYFTGMNFAQQQTGILPAGQAASIPTSYMLPSQYAAGRSQSPLDSAQRNVFAVPQHLALAQPRQNQQLCVVTFKCCRSEVFYIQEGTGLHVKPGDLVIVEADRGTDLGTVANANVSWTKAKELKEHYAEEHYKWLMMFSKHSGQGVNPNGSGANGTSAGQGAMSSAIGGMGPQSGQQGMQEVNPGELKPKMIKRLAQNHEIQTLKDKEGNEAKAKRVCQQKVVEHRLQMEILDAEFQMDWKKLTFYYFADAYINFNSLVTELFKVYKTRIWMSAINPASFASPSSGIQPPSGIGPGALGFGRNSPMNQRQQVEPLQYGPLSQYRGFQPTYGPPSNLGPSGPVAQTAALHNPYAYTFQPFGQQPRQHANVMADFQHAVPQPGELAIDYAQPDFGGMRAGQTGAGSAPGLAPGNRAHHMSPDAWVNSFEDLSLGSR
ncbi:MAG: hypothetical protein M1825_002879 [Sarcosagium campestre]|nr:MAG: hypothetical protein M1825_002879 [Sarcosagium campestre]